VYSSTLPRGASPWPRRSKHGTPSSPVQHLHMSAVNEWPPWVAPQDPIPRLLTRRRQARAPVPGAVLALQLAPAAHQGRDSRALGVWKRAQMGQTPNTAGGCATLTKQGCGDRSPCTETPPGSPTGPTQSGNGGRPSRSQGSGVSGRTLGDPGVRMQARPGYSRSRVLLETSSMPRSADQFAGLVHGGSSRTWLANRAPDPVRTGCIAVGGFALVDPW